MAVKSKKEQLDWIVAWATRKMAEQKLGWDGLDAHNQELLAAFEDFSNAKVGWSLWKSRIREAAEQLGLVGKRNYIPDGGHGYLPRYTVVYR